MSYRIYAASREEWAERALRAEAILTEILPLLRRNAEDLLRCVSIHNDPSTISGADWRDIAADLEAVVSLEAIVGRPDDDYGALLDRVLDTAPWEAHR